MKKTVKIELYFDTENENFSPNANIPDTQDVPLTLVLQSLSNLSKGVAKAIVADAEGFIPDSGLEKYLDSRIKVDKQNFYK